MTYARIAVLALVSFGCKQPKLPDLGHGPRDFIENLGSMVDLEDAGVASPCTAWNPALLPIVLHAMRSIDGRRVVADQGTVTMPDRWW
jgi:hypothetical protein